MGMDATRANYKNKLDQDFNYVKPQDWIKRMSGLQKRLDLDYLTLEL